MSPIIGYHRAGLLILVLSAVLSACGTPNDQAAMFNADTGRHGADWLPEQHRTAYSADPGACTACHGADYSGGITSVACNDCHLGGPDSIHPEAWGRVLALNHAAYVRTSGSAACGNVVCHGSSLTGVEDGGPSCTTCHIGGPTNAHPAAWTGNLALHGPYIYANGLQSCRNIYCHGAGLEGVAESGPACSTCH